MIRIFPYQWSVYDKEIRVYGFNEENQPTLLRITDFTPYVYVKLPANIVWTPQYVSRLVETLKKTSRGRILKSTLVYRRPLYYADVFLNERNTLKFNQQPYLLIAFESDYQRKNFAYNSNRTISVMNLGNVAIEIYEHNASPVLQLTCVRKISTADWFVAKNITVPPESVSRLNNEYSVHWKNLMEDTSAPQSIPCPLIMSYDIECVFHNPNKFSDGSHPNDRIFQISCVFGRQSQPKETWRKILLTLGNPEKKLLPNIEIFTFKKEFSLLLGFSELIIRENPQILIGYNIFKFDIPFMYKRAQELRIHDDFVKHGCTWDKCKLETIRWSSSAYSNQEMNFLDLQGRLTIDVLTLVQRDFDLESYKLDYVSEKFLGSNKDPLDHHDIFNCYHLGMRESQNDGISKSMSLVGKYCVKDSILVLELFEKFQYWYSLTEMAKICQVPHSHLFLYGQQLKVFSQVYKFCYQNNIVVESGRWKPDEDDICTGASVLTPQPGLYENVVSFDFCSLYPSVIISHNIDFTTLLPEGTNIPPDMYRTIEWEEHINCKCEHAVITNDTKDVRCKRYSYKWLSTIPGILPTIIKNLLQARKEVRNQMKSIDKSSLLYNVLNKRQLAYKVSSNSMYGALTTKRGYLPFLPAGMCITAVGRQSLEKVSKIITENYGGNVVYGDTDSNYVIFPHLQTLPEIWDYSIKVSDEVSKFFPEPMRLEFEDNIYARYLILSKKRYLYLSVTIDGIISSKIENKGVLLKRRDNSKLVRDIYEYTIRMILNKQPETSVIWGIVDLMSKLYSRDVKVEEFSMSKSVKGIENFQKSYRDSKTIQYGDYVVPKIKENPIERINQLKEKSATTDDEFYQSHLPGAVQLALRMRSRGQHIESGSRLSYVVTRRLPHDRNVSEKIEEIEYFSKYYTRQMIDTLHYIHLLINPIEEVLIVVYGNKYKNFIKDMYKYRIKYDTVINQLFSLFHPIKQDHSFFKTL